MAAATAQHGDDAPAARPAARVSILAFDLHTGGAERVAARLAGGLPPERFSADLVLRDPSPPQRSTPLAAAVETRIVPADVPQVWYRELAALWARRVPDVVVAHVNTLNQQALLARHRLCAGFPVVLVEHTMVGRYLAAWQHELRWAVELAYRTVYADADAVVVPHEDVAADLARFTGLPESRITVIPNPALEGDPA